MTVLEFGKQNQATVLLLHGGGLSWWNYREVAKLLEKDCHVILPVLDGHGGSGAFWIPPSCCTKPSPEAAWKSCPASATAI